MSSRIVGNPREPISKQIGRPDLWAQTRMRSKSITGLPNRVANVAKAIPSGDQKRMSLKNKSVTQSQAERYVTQVVKSKLGKKGDPLNVTAPLAPPPAAKKQDPLNTTSNLSGVIRGRKAKPTLQESHFKRSHSAPHLVKNNRLDRRPISETWKTKPQESDVDDFDSTKVVRRKGRQSLPTTEVVISTNSESTPSETQDTSLQVSEETVPPLQLSDSIMRPRTMSIRTGSPSDLDFPDLSPHDVSEKKDRNLSGSFRPQRRLSAPENPEQKEDEGGESTAKLNSARKPELPPEDPKFSQLCDDFYPIVTLMKIKEPGLIWTEPEELKKYARSIKEHLEAQLKIRGKEFFVREDSLEDWKVACGAIKRIDEISLSKITAKIIPYLKRKGFLTHIPDPSPWRVLYELRTNREAAASLRALDLNKLELKEFPHSFRVIHLPNVKKVLCAENAFKLMPKELPFITPSAELVSFASNEIHQYPAEIYRFKNLMQLNLANNQIAELPEPEDLGFPDVSEYADRVLDVTLKKNCIKEIDFDSLARLDNLTMHVHLHMEGNPVPLEDLPSFHDEIHKTHTVGSVTIHW